MCSRSCPSSGYESGVEDVLDIQAIDNIEEYFEKKIRNGIRILRGHFDRGVILVALVYNQDSTCNEKAMRDLSSA